MKYLIFLFLALTPLCNSIEDWQPVLQPEYYQQNTKPEYPAQPSFSSLVAQRYQPVAPSQGGQCDVYKIGFTQDLYFQYVQYKTSIPELKEFTLCFWSKFNNHSNDHPLFSYAVEGQPRGILSWVSNTERSSYFSMAVEGHTFYRLNYPLRLNRWYHTCQSWNGRTGEWQIWVNAERVGRGFHNRLVGHVISSGGVALTGQEQSQTGGGFQEGYDAPQGSGGMLGELTMLQLYSVALTAGKAHKDHKHHHAHKYDHNGAPITTTPPPLPAPRPTQPTHPLLTAGQLNPNVALNIAAQQQLGQPIPQLIPGQNYDAQLVNGQFAGSLVTQQFLQAQAGNQQQAPQTFQPQPAYPLLQQQPQTDLNSYSQQTLTIGGRPLVNSGLVHPSLVNPANVQFIETPQIEAHMLFKRENEENPTEFGDRITKKEHKKRELYLADGQLLDDGLLSSSAFDKNLLDGLAGIGQNEPILMKQMREEEREPAEAEVKAVMGVCTGCDAEPFGKALVIAWRSVPKKLYSGAFYQPAVAECRVF